MTDKVQKIREEVEKLKSQLLRGACASQIAMETRCKEEAYNEVLAILDTMQEEPVSEDFEDALAREWQGYNDRGAATVDAFEDNTQELAFAKGFYLGAKWKEHQFEKNRLAACDRQTKEEAEREQDFVMSIIKEGHRQPTFDDAIKYGMRLQDEQMMANTADAMIGLPYENKHNGYTHLVDVSRPLPVGKNKIAIIFKED